MNWFSSMMQDGIDGSVSSKRVVTFSAFLLCAIAFVANLFWQFKIESFIYDSMSYIAMAGLGATVAEKFSGRQSTNYQSSGFSSPTSFPQQNTVIQQNGFQQNPFNSTQDQSSMVSAPTKIHGTPLPQQQDPLI